MPAYKLSSFPYVVVRLGCRLCKRSGSYRLARLAEKHGAETSLNALLAALTIDCPHRPDVIRKRRKLEAFCEARFIDLDAPVPPPPDMPPAMQRLRLVASKDDDEHGSTPLVASASRRD